MDVITMMIMVCVILFVIIVIHNRFDELYRIPMIQRFFLLGIVLFVIWKIEITRKIRISILVWLVHVYGTERNSFYFRAINDFECFCFYGFYGFCIDIMIVLMCCEFTK